MKREEWNRKYASPDFLWSTEPNRFLVAEAEVELTERNPRGLTAPAGLDELCFERQHRLEGLAGPRGGFPLHSREKAHVCDLDLDVHAHKSSAAALSRQRRWKDLSYARDPAIPAGLAARRLIMLKA